MPQTWFQRRCRCALCSIESSVIAVVVYFLFGDVPRFAVCETAARCQNVLYRRWYIVQFCFLSILIYERFWNFFRVISYIYSNFSSGLYIFYLQCCMAYTFMGVVVIHLYLMIIFAYIELLRIQPHILKFQGVFTQAVRRLNSKLKLIDSYKTKNIKSVLPVSFV